MAKRKVTAKTDESRQPIKLEYIGNGSFWPGIPARDLVADEIALYWPQIQRNQLGDGSQLYQPSYERIEPAQSARISDEEG